MAESTNITLAQAIKHEVVTARWSAEDRTLAKQHIERVGGKKASVPPSGGYVKILDGEGKVVMWLDKSCLTFRVDTAPDDAIASYADNIRKVNLSNARGAKKDTGTKPAVAKKAAVKKPKGKPAAPTQTASDVDAALEAAEAAVDAVVGE